MENGKVLSANLDYRFIEPLGRALAPANLRFGGTLADMAVFQENATVSEKRREKYNGYIPNFYYNGKNPHLYKKWWWIYYTQATGGEFLLKP